MSCAVDTGPPSQPTSHCSRMGKTLEGRRFLKLSAVSLVGSLRTDAHSISRLFIHSFVYYRLPFFDVKTKRLVSRVDRILSLIPLLWIKFRGQSPLPGS